MHPEKHALLTELVELRIAIQQARADKLVKDTKNKRRHDCEEDVVEG